MAPTSVDELLKGYEQYAKDALASLSASRRASTELSSRYAEVVERIKEAGEALNAEIAVVQEQFEAEVEAATTSPLVDRSKRAYQALVEAYTREVAAVVSGTAHSQPDLGIATRRAADAYTRAIADLTAELARQVSAAYERYLSGLVRVSLEADIAGIVASGNEDLVKALVSVYAPSEPAGAAARRSPDAGAAPALAGSTGELRQREDGGDNRTDVGWDSSGGGWEDAAAPTWEDAEASPWESTGASETGDASAWGATSEPDWEDIVASDEPEEASTERADRADDRPHEQDPHAPDGTSGGDEAGSSVRD